MVLRGLATHATAADAVELPRFTVLAVDGQRIHFFDMAAVERATKAGETVAAVGSVRREDARVEIKRGLMWKRVTVLDTAGQRSYTVYLNALAGGRRVGRTLSALSNRS